MKVSNICLLVLTAAASEVAATAGALNPSGIDVYSREDNTFTPQINRNGWVNPEDLAAMPQCVAQQDQSAWLSAMTKCTSHRCTSHFGIICTHHQWLTQLSCLSIEFSPSVIKDYLPYCSRSVLAKAQLYQWVHGITGRTWLVEVGDANGLETISPTSLAEGYASFSVIDKAPTCLTESNSASSIEAFQHVIASCSFTAAAKHTGNAARPWEYSEALQSMIALDYETVGYDRTHRTITAGDYFDKECFCTEFTVSPNNEPCPGLGGIGLTRERLWMYATCGPKSVPDNWASGLKTPGLEYIRLEDWQWPTCVKDMPNEVTKLSGHCETDACETDSDGYCRIIPAVDRACFCHGISYGSCGGSCHTFEGRADYLDWLHSLCSDVQGWHGLPEDWQQLAAPTRLELIPWRWTLKPSNGTARYPKSTKPIETCPPKEWKLGCFALINLATFLAPYLVRETGMDLVVQQLLRLPRSQGWVFAGISMTAIQLLANWFNVSIVQATIGYQHIPAFQLMLLWCTMPRFPSLMTVIAGGKPFKAKVASFLFAETIFQSLSLYYMFMTVKYGWEHNLLDFEYMEGLEDGASALFMYAGACVWLIVAIGLFVALFRAWNMESWLLSEETVAQHSIHGRRAPEEASLKGRGQGEQYTTYGTLPVEERQDNLGLRKSSIQLHVVAIATVFLWIAQWHFWVGFIALSLEEFCPPKLGALTAVWAASSSASAIVGTI